MQTNAKIEICICSFSAKHAEFMSKSKDCVYRNQDNMSEWAVRRMIFQWAITIKIQHSILIIEHYLWGTKYMCLNFMVLFFVILYIFIFTLYNYMYNMMTLTLQYITCLTCQWYLLLQITAINFNITIKIYYLYNYLIFLPPWYNWNIV